MEAPPGTEPRQRWRLVYRRSPDAPRLAQRELAEALDTAVVRSGLPLPARGRRGPLAFGAALPTGMPAERELVDLLLSERRPRWQVRDCLAAHLPEGCALVDVYDVWLGEPPLPGQVAAAVYRFSLGEGEPPQPGPVELRDAAERLLAARSLPRERSKGERIVRYDLRPLLLDVTVAAPSDGSADEGAVLRVVTRIDPELGSGRPEEVLAALGGLVGRPLHAASTVREAVLLRDEVLPGRGWSSPDQSSWLRRAPVGAAQGRA